MKNKTLYLYLGIFVISVSCVYCIYSKPKITHQCEMAYDDYLNYMDKINNIAIDNGFEEQPKLSLNEFCKS